MLTRNASTNEDGAEIKKRITAPSVMYTLNFYHQRKRTIAQLKCALKITIKRDLLNERVLKDIPSVILINFFHRILSK
jgi:hypothetical protein